MSERWVVCYITQAHYSCALMNQRDEKTQQQQQKKQPYSHCCFTFWVWVLSCGHSSAASLFILLSLFSPLKLKSGDSFCSMSALEVFWPPAMCVCVCACVHLSAAKASSLHTVQTHSHLPTRWEVGRVARRHKSECWHGLSGGAIVAV